MAAGRATVRRSGERSAQPGARTAAALHPALCAAARKSRGAGAAAAASRLAPSTAVLRLRPGLAARLGSAKARRRSGGSGALR